MGRRSRTFESCHPDMTNPFRIRCNLCEDEDDLRKMKKFQGEYYHNVKIPNNKTTCLEAVKNNAKRR